MRIIAGRYKGVELSAPHGHKTHPMSEKLRGAIFNALGDIDGLEVFDPFAGTGAVSIEAMSRGAKSAVCIEQSIDAMNCLKENIAKVGSDNIKALRMNCSVYSDENQEKTFDLVFLDPPFDAIKPTLVAKLCLRHCKQKGLVVLNLPTGTQVDLGEEFEHIQNNAHGDATLWFYRKIN